MPSSFKLGDALDSLGASPPAEGRDPTVDSAIQLTLGDLQQLESLELDWNGYGAIPIDNSVILAAGEWICELGTEIKKSPQVVPMTQGRLQFEWHVGARSLELEFETPQIIHYLKWQPNEGIEEEGTFSTSNQAESLRLIRWIMSEDGHA